MAAAALLASVGTLNALHNGLPLAPSTIDTAGNNLNDFTLLNFAAWVQYASPNVVRGVQRPDLSQLATIAALSSDLLRNAHTAACDALTAVYEGLNACALPHLLPHFANARNAEPPVNRPATWLFPGVPAIFVAAVRLQTLAGTALYVAEQALFLQLLNVCSPAFSRNAILGHFGYTPHGANPLNTFPHKVDTSYVQILRVSKLSVLAEEARIKTELTQRARSAAPLPWSAPELEWFAHVHACADRVRALNSTNANPLDPLLILRFGSSEATANGASMFQRVTDQVDLLQGRLVGAANESFVFRNWCRIDATASVSLRFLGMAPAYCGLALSMELLATRCFGALLVFGPYANVSSGGIPANVRWHSPVPALSGAIAAARAALAAACPALNTQAATLAAAADINAFAVFPAIMLVCPLLARALQMPLFLMLVPATITALNAASRHAFGVPAAPVPAPPAAVPAPPVAVHFSLLTVLWLYAGADLCVPLPRKFTTDTTAQEAGTLSDTFHGILRTALQGLGIGGALAAGLVASWATTVTPLVSQAAAALVTATIDGVAMAHPCATFTQLLNPPPLSGTWAFLSYPPTETIPGDMVSDIYGRPVPTLAYLAGIFACWAGPVLLAPAQQLWAVCTSAAPGLAAVRAQLNTLGAPAMVDLFFVNDGLGATTVCGTPASPAVQAACSSALKDAFFTNTFTASLRFLVPQGKDVCAVFSAWFADGATHNNVSVRSCNITGVTRQVVEALVGAGPASMWGVATTLTLVVLTAPAAAGVAAWGRIFVVANLHHPSWPIGEIARGEPILRASAADFWLGRRLPEWLWLYAFPCAIMMRAAVTAPTLGPCAWELVGGGFSAFAQHLKAVLSSRGGQGHLQHASQPDAVAEARGLAWLATVGPTLRAQLEDCFIFRFHVLEHAFVTNVIHWHGRCGGDDEFATFFAASKHHLHDLSLANALTQLEGSLGPELFTKACRCGGFFAQLADPDALVAAFVRMRATLGAAGFALACRCGGFFAKLADPAALIAAFDAVRPSFDAGLANACGSNSFYSKLGAPGAKVCNPAACASLIRGIDMVRPILGDAGFLSACRCDSFFSKLADPVALVVALNTVRPALEAGFTRACGSNSFYAKLGAPRAKVCSPDATDAFVLALYTVRATLDDDDVFVAQLRDSFFAQIPLAV